MRNTTVYPSLYVGNNDDHQMLNSDIPLHSTMPNHNSSDLQEKNINNQVLGSFSPLSAIEIPSPLNYLSLLPGLHPISDASVSNIIASSTTTAMHRDAAAEQLYAQYLFSAHRNSLDNDGKRTIVKSDIGSATVEGSIKRTKNVVPIAMAKDDRHPQSQYFVDKRMSEPTRGKQPKAQEKWLLELEKAKAKRQQLEVTQVQSQIRQKRSQKIGDKIITLQKLVSPFGKTDTASVLKDTADHIKMLYNQIELLTNPYFQPDAFLHHYHKQHDLQVGTGEMSNGLAERGLCLVPVSFTQNITKQEKR
ncbi:uncharacterized protein LOC113308549 isoform X2 [Papaver somniferum]|uniref:uncharacterized protein LOC113308549 isoform X2 n=1 Tax=Papaver somniferum TaxID=3469 RepID=UPI000E6F9165|nr:uncharacterized protein LOC113308549 isoform X2 [Papaver somniferum]